MPTECLEKTNAKNRGDNTYKGRPCKEHGHTLRYVSNGSCVECRRELNKNNRRIEGNKKIKSNEIDYNHKVMIIGKPDISNTI
ncbi:hypothetical protein PU01_20480 [Hafnia alvei]|nr:hypothetical protein PU01_20480 [Hafnia alvei]